MDSVAISTGPPSCTMLVACGVASFFFYTFYVDVLDSPLESLILSTSTRAQHLSEGDQRRPQRRREDFWDLNGWLWRNLGGEPRRDQAGRWQP